MPSLAFCISKHSPNEKVAEEMRRLLMPAEAANLKKGFTEDEARKTAVEKAMNAAESERANIVEQIKKQLPEYFKAPEVEVTAGKDKKIGEREKGGEIFERADGHRYIIKNGVLVDSPRDILPTGKPLPPKTPKQLFDEKRWDYLTKEEIASFEELGEPAPGYKKVEYSSAEELAKEGFESWDTVQGYNDEEAKGYLERKQEKRPSVEFRLVRYSDDTLALWGRPKDLTKAEKADKVEPKLAADMTADEMLSEWDEQAGEIEPTAKEKAAEAKAHLSKATDAFKAINEILGEKGVIFEGVDESRWQKIKPLLKVAFDEIIAAGKSGKEFVQIALKNLSPKGKPYFERFVKEEIGKEGKDVTDNIRRDESQKTAKADDTERIAGEGAKDVSGIKKELRPAKVSEGDRGTDDVGVSRGVVKSSDKTQRAGTDRERNPDSAGSKAGDVAKENLGRDTGNISGLQRSDYIIKPGSLKREGSWKDAATNNLDAIELLKKINKEKRPATPKEQKILAKYVGWGASELANKMFPGYAQNGEIIPGWADGGWKPSIKRLIKALTPEEVKAAAKSTQYAHYTNEPIIKSIYNALAKMGFESGKILEPGMGIGNFIGLLPAKMRKTSNYTGVEMDPISAGIAKLLYPTQNMLQADFVNQVFPKNFFDAAIGNPPFGSTKIIGDPEYRKHRFSLHNFFFAKTIDRVKPGGLLVFVTSRYTMDSKADKARKYMSDRADLLGAIRLPQTAFLESAGTEVVTDVLFLQKREEGTKPKGETWSGQSEVSIGDSTSLINEYFVAHPEMVLGEHSLEGSMYGAKQYTVTPVEGKIEDLFAQAVKKLPANVYQKVSTKVQEKYDEKAVIERDFDPKNKKEGGVYLSDKGVVMKVDFGSGVPANSIHKNITPKTTGFLKSYIKLRDALKLSHKAQLENGDWEKALKVLNKEYDRFIKKHGNILAFTSTMRTKRNEDGTTEKVEYRKYKNGSILCIDCESSLVMSLEKITQDGEIVKSSILQGKTVNKPTVPKIESIPDALAVSLDTIGRLDINHVAKTANKPNEEIIATLGDLIYDAPDGSGYLMADDYLSGNVVKKLAEAKVAAIADPAFERNVLALEKAQPEPLEPKQITITLGATWIPLEYYSQFATEILELPNTEVTYQPIDNSWRVLPRKDTRSSWERYGDRQGYSPQELRGAASEWGTKERGANEILDSVLNNRTIRITYTIEEDGSRKTIFDAEATAAANEVAKKIRKRFNSWAWEDADRASILLNIYNTKINTIKGREFDGSHLTLPGMSQYFTPYDHQKRVIWRILQTGNTYMAHAVGAGKTFIMISAGMEMRRLGMINKPLYVVPKHMLGQFAQEFQELYPMANILVADEQNFYTENRKRFVAQAALNDPDAVILTHPSFGMLGVREETLAPVRDEFLEQMRLSLSDMQDEGEPKMKIKRMEKRIEQAEQRFNSLRSDGDNVVSFEELGTDFMFVDEAHEFRKLDFATNRQMKGIDPQGSRRAIDLYIKTLWMERQHPGRSHAFASGTPIVNTLGELYSLQRFFDQGTMEEDGINHFDAWANMFGEPAADYEMNASGKHELVERFSRFVNIPELMSRIRMFMDVLTNSQLGTRVDRPEVKGGAAEIVLAARNETLKKYQDEVLQPRIEASRAWKPSPGQPGNPDPIINIITDGKLASIDMRFVDKKAKNDPESKLNKYIDGIIETYKETKDLTYSIEYGSAKKSPIKGGGQICFYNSGFGKGVTERRGFNAKAFLMKRLEAAGIPTKHIGWIDDYKTAPQKQTLFKLVRDGKKRILLGSAKKMGTGVNVQNRLTHLHYLDTPWYPADVEQPDGRIVRQGNQNTEVVLKRYATKGSYDATLWQMVARKSKFIDQAFVGDKNVRSIEDISEISQYEMAAALASGDERVVQLVGLRADIERLHLLEGAHRSNQRTLASNRRNLERDISGNQADIEDFESVEESLPEYIGPKIDAKVGNVDFTERKEFGAALIKQIKKIFAGKKDDQVKLGSISGIDVNTETITVSKYAHKLDIGISKDDFRYRIENTYMSIDQWNETDSVGLTKKITNAINGLPSVKTKTEQALKENEKKLARINKRLGAPFEHSKEFAEKVAEAAALERELAEEGESAETIEAEVSKKQEIAQAEEVLDISAFYIYSIEKEKYVKLSPESSVKPLETAKTGTTWGETFFIHKPLGETEGWVISEKESGLAAASGKTQEEAIGRLKYNLTTVTEEQFNKIVEDHIEKYGERPGAKVDSLSEVKDHLTENIKSEKGESALINDLAYIGADIIKQGHKSFKAFSAQMKTTLSEVWNKIKHLMRKAYEAAKIVLKSERGAITLREGKPPEKATKPGKDYSAMFEKYRVKHTTPLVGELIKKTKANIDPVNASPEETKAFFKDIHLIPKRFRSEVMSIRDMKWYHKALETPYVLAKKFTSMKAAVKTEIKRHESRTKKVFDYYHGDLEGLQKHMQKNPEDLKTFEDLIWKWEGRRFSEKEVPTDWYSVVEDKKDDDYGDLRINPKHYTEVRAYLKKQGVKDVIADGFISVRKLLDNVLIEADTTMRGNNIDQSDLEEFRSYIGKAHNYFSHVREGNSYIKITNRNTRKTVYREHFWEGKERLLPKDKMAKARTEAWLNDQLASGKLLGKRSDYLISRAQKVTQLPDEIFFQIPVEALSQISTEAGKGLSASRVHYEAKRLMKLEGLSAKEAHEKADKTLTADIERHLARAMADVLKTRGWGKHAIQRQNIPGFKKTDIFETLSGYLTGYAGFATKIQAAKEHSKTLRSMDARKTPNAYKYTSEYIRDMLSNADKTDRMVDRLRAMFFVKYLGGVVKSGMVNLTQNVVMAGPVLSQYTKFSHTKLARAMKDTRKGITGKNAWMGRETDYKNLPKNEQAALIEGVETGVAQDLYLRELKGEIPGKGWGKYVNKVISKAGIFMMVAEKFNRASTLLAAYRVGFNEGILFEGKQTKGDHALSLQFAKGVVYDSHFLYGKPNLPAAFRGGDFRKYARAAYTFRSFTHNYLDIMVDLMANQGTQGFKVAGRSLMNLMVVGGLTSIPFFKALSEVIKWASDDDDEDLLTEIRAKMPNKFMQDVVTYGLVGAAGGFDLSGSLSIEVPRNFKDIIGVPYAAKEDYMNMVKSIKAGNTYRAVAETPFTPIAIRNAMRGIELYTEGQRTRGGKAINVPGKREPRKISGVKAVKKAVLGLQDVDISSGYKAYRAAAKMKIAISDRKRDWADKIANATIDRNFKKVREIKAEIRAWNLKARRERKLWRVVDIDKMIENRLQGKGLKGFPVKMRKEAKARYNVWQ